MKKRISLLVLFCIFIMVWVAVISEQNKTTWLDLDEDGIYISLRSDNKDEVLRPWIDYGNNEVNCFFLPAFADEKDVYIDKSLDSVNIDDTIVQSGQKFTWQTDEVYKIEVGDTSYHVKFMRSENLPALFLDTESGNMEYIRADKENEETGKLAVITADGHLQYAGALDKISGRGNTTWEWSYKKPYSITLHEEKALCGLEAGKKWTLLALYYEHDKIHSKIIFDLARELGIPYTPECTWVDLYCNGEYEGLYLLTEAVTVAEGRVEIHDLEKDNENVNSDIDLDEEEIVIEDNRSGYDILSPADYTGGYLIEKDNRYSSDKGPRFVTSSGYKFGIKSPKHASLIQVKYIAQFVQNIEDMMVLGDYEYRNYIDMESFARQFLLDKIVLDVDAMRFSAYFYKEQYKDVLVSGPVWDYDRAVGEVFSDYTEPIEETGENQDRMQSWYGALYQDPQFYDMMVAEYKKILPYLAKILSEDIDYYVEYINASVKMDYVYMQIYTSPNETFSYREYDNYIRYLKFFLANRLNYLNAIWGISDMYFETPASTGEYHDVIFKDMEGNIVETRKVLDGEFIEEFPALEQEENLLWRMNFGKTYDGKIPIFEDADFTAYHPD